MSENSLFFMHVPIVSSYRLVQTKTFFCTLSEVRGHSQGVSEARLSVLNMIFVSTYFFLLSQRSVEMTLLYLLQLFESGRIKPHLEQFCCTMSPFRVKNHIF